MGVAVAVGSCVSFEHELPERARTGHPRNVHAVRATWVGEQRETTRAGAAASQGTHPFALAVAAGILSYPYKALPLTGLSLGHSRDELHAGRVSSLSGRGQGTCTPPGLRGRKSSVGQNMKRVARNRRWRRRAKEHGRLLSLRPAYSPTHRRRSR